MGLPMLPGRDVRKVRAGTATPLLDFLAGPRAGAVAHLFPAPHEDFYVLPAGRRHAAAVLLDRYGAGTGRLSVEEIRHAVTRAKDSEVAGLLMGRPRPGLMKTLGRLGERLWKQAADYQRLLDLYAEDEAAKVLRHMEEIRPKRLTFIAALPEVFRVAKVVDVAPTLAAAQDLAKAWALVVQLHGPDRARAMARDWIRIKERQAFFDAVMKGLKPAAFAPMTPPPALGAPFEAVTTAKGLDAVALEFKNCLRDFEVPIARGMMAVYAWRGTPKAAVALRVDAAGWRLAEAEGVGNDELKEATLREIVMGLKPAGVRAGVSVYTLGYRLHRHGCKRCGPDHRRADTGWVEALELGDLWDN